MQTYKFPRNPFGAGQGSGSANFQYFKTLNRLPVGLQGPQEVMSGGHLAQVKLQQVFLLSGALTAQNLTLHIHQIDLQGSLVFAVEFEEDGIGGGVGINFDFVIGFQVRIDRHHGIGRLVKALGNGVGGIGNGGYRGFAHRPAYGSGGAGVIVSR